MVAPKIYADFQNLDDHNRLRLTCAGTLEDLKREGIQLQEGMQLTFYTDDADDEGRPDEMRVQGTVHYDQQSRNWVADVDWRAIWHASDEAVSKSNGGTQNRGTDNQRNVWQCTHCLKPFTPQKERVDTVVCYSTAAEEYSVRTATCPHCGRENEKRTRIDK